LSPKRCVNKMANMSHQWRMQNSAAVRQTGVCVPGYIAPAAREDFTPVAASRLVVCMSYAFSKNGKPAKQRENFRKFPNLWAYV
jgi:hypothetical protein